MKLGLIDSGIGQITILNRLREINSDIDYVILADQKNLPFGNKSKAELLEISRRNVDFLITKNVNKILFACNTISANCLSDIRVLYPNIEIEGIIEKTSELIKDKKYQNVLVLATSATVESNAYYKELSKFFNGNIIQRALPDLCDLIESNQSKEIILKYLFDNIHCYNGCVDAIILGCTHYPLVLDKIKEIIDVDIYSSDMAFTADDLIGNGSGELTFYCNKNANGFQKKLVIFFGIEAKVIQV